VGEITRLDDGAFHFQHQYPDGWLLRCRRYHHDWARKWWLVHRYESPWASVMGSYPPAKAPNFPPDVRAWLKERTAPYNLATVELISQPPQAFIKEIATTIVQFIDDRDAVEFRLRWDTREIPAPHLWADEVGVTLV
jgi:hypothetical protein